MNEDPVITSQDTCGPTQRSELLALVAHELRNPISAIAMATQVIKRTAVMPAVQQAVAGIDRQIALVRRIVDDLTDVSRLVNNKIMLQVQPVEICTLCEQSIAGVQTLIDTKHHVIEVKCESKRIMADGIRLQQVISNILSNAAKFTPSGGNISLTAVSEGEGVRITIKDNGKGMTPETMARIFDMFYQGELHSGSGLGVGLTLAKRMVELHDGTIEVYSAGIDKGTTFTIHLPACPRQPAKRSVRVLIVDDNVDHANAMSVLLELENYHVRCAYDGQSGLEEVDKFQPDVIFLDIGMPIMDGYEVISRIYKKNGMPYIVAVTGFNQPGDRMRIKVAGFDEHIVKPPEDKQIFAILERIAKEKDYGG